jgi:hypothetical protein
MSRIGSSSCLSSRGGLYSPTAVDNAHASRVTGSRFLLLRQQSERWFCHER